jgi:hypothetical protein
MIPVMQNKVILPEPVLGYVILRATQLVVERDCVAKFMTLSFDDGFRARKVFPMNGIELMVEATGDAPIDTRLVYSDFVVNGFVPYIGETERNSKNREALVNEVQTFENEIMQAIEIARWETPPALEHETCWWCRNSVALTWNAQESQWDCRSHGLIPEDCAVMKMIYPF